MNLDSIDWGGLALNAVYAVLIILVTWILARVVKNVLSRLLKRIRVLNNRSADGSTTADSLASIASLLIWLFGLVALLNLFGLTSVLAPIQNLLNSVFAYIPNLLGAGLVFFFGLVLARIVRDLAVTALNTVNFDRLLNRAGMRTNQAVAHGMGEARHAQAPQAQAAQAQAAPAQMHHAQPGQMPPQAPQGQMPPQMQGQMAQGQMPPQAPQGQMAPGHMVQGQPPAPQGSSITRTIGQILYAIVLVVVTIAALQILNIQAISQPATAMLQMILNAIPSIIGAGILLAIGVVVARFVSGLLVSVLRTAGVDEALSKMGINPKSRDASAIIGLIVQIAIVIFFAVAATRLLGFPEITAMLDAILLLGSRIVIGALVIAAGVFIANLIAGVASGTASTVIRYATIVLFIAMGLSFMGLADSIVNLAFGALVIGGAAAGALAFGLGGREAAARELKELQDGRAKKPASKSSK